jgi:hypothetical protein
MKATTWLALALLLLAAGLRLGGINSQLWLDEIWSIRLAQTAETPLGVFTHPLLHHDNNHWLNTLVVQFIGPGRPFWLYRLLPEITGIGTVLLGWLLARRYGAYEGICALILLAMSEFLIEFASDARGYAPAAFFGLLCLWLMQRLLVKPNRWTAIAMGTSAVLGLLSHLTFLAILCGLIAGSAISAWRKNSWTSALARAAIWWAAPCAAIVLLYLVDLRYMVRGGGPLLTDLPQQTAQMVLGLPGGFSGATAIGLIAWLIAAVRCTRLWAAADDAWPVYAAAVLLVPVFLFGLQRSDYLHPRYIYVAVPLLLMLIGMELGHWLWHGQWVGRTLAVIALLGFCVANFFPTVNFLRLGRGQYCDALAFLIAHSAGRNIIVGADTHPKSTLMVLEYYQTYVPAEGHRLLTLRGEEWNGQWPQWIIAEQYYGRTMHDQDGVPYICRAVFLNGGVASGIFWAVYESATNSAFVRPGNLATLATQ